MHAVKEPGFPKSSKCFYQIALPICLNRYTDKFRFCFDRQTNILGILPNLIHLSDYSVSAVERDSFILSRDNNTDPAKLCDDAEENLAKTHPFTELPVDDTNDNIEK